MWILEALGLGVGLAMDASAVSTTNGLTEPKMKVRKMFLISGMFGFFQMLMPIIGYLAVTTFSTILGEKFTNVLMYLIPYLALGILCFLGIKLIIDTVKKDEEKDSKKITFGVIFIQSIATSIDALSIGVVRSSLPMFDAMITFLIIGIITFMFCFLAIILGKKFGNLFSSKAGIIGGAILVFIGFEIFFSNWDLVEESFKFIFQLQ